MALLAFDLPSGSGLTSGTSTALEPPSHIAELLSVSQKLKTAGELNAAILASQSQSADPKLPQMLRLMSYGEDLLCNTGPGKTHFPKLSLLQVLRGSNGDISDENGDGKGQIPEVLVQGE